jgi:regulator of sigma D
METLSGKEDKIFEIIDRVLTQVFGEEATLFIYKYLEQHYSLHQSEFSEKIDVFAKGLEDFLSSGAFAIENKILEDIYSSYSSLHRAGLERAFEEYDFASQIKIAVQKA